MDSLPSPTSSPEDSPTSAMNLGRKRARSSASSDASSSKRAMSEDPSQAGNAKDDLNAPMTTSASSVDVTAKLASMHRIQDENTPAVLSEGLRKHLQIMECRRKRMEVGETRYLVAQSWYIHWEKACNGVVDKDGPYLESDLGPVDNSEFIGEDGNFNYNTSLIEDIDVQYVDQTAWDLFKEWYGEPEYELARKVIPSGSLPRLEVRPPIVKVLLLIKSNSLVVPDAPVINITVSVAATMTWFTRRLNDVLPIPDPGAEIRIWRVESQGTNGNTYPSAKLLKEGGRLVDQKAETVEKAMIFNGDVLVIERKGADGTWIIDSDGDIESSGAENDENVEPLFASNSSFFAKMGTDKAEQRGSASSSALIPSAPMKTGLSLPGKAKSTGRGSIPGTLGLVNMGNTCFMNSALQCLAHTEILIDYFLTDVYQHELNPDNPLGMQGEIAEAFGALLLRIWSVGGGNSYAPREFKAQLQRFAPQFSGYQQHDSQELVAFLLDGLHEDLNRIKNKPYVEKPDWEGGGDKELIELAKESWKGYLLRNDSVIVDLFQGQYRSTLVCPECEKVSITFDPFMYLTLPLPVQKKWRHKVFYIPWDLKKPHVRIPVELNRNATFKEVRHLLGRWMNANPDNLLTMEVFSNRFYKDLDDTVYVTDMTETDVIVCYELPCHAQQSRTWSPDPDPTKYPLIVPVHLCKEAPGSRYSYSRYPNGFSHPFVIVLDYEQLRDKDKVYEAIVERLERWTSRPDELYRQEECNTIEVTLSDSELRTSVTEIRENGDIKVVEEVPDEGDIVDEKSVILEENETVVERIQTVKRVGPKPELFQMHIQTGNDRLGTSTTTWTSTVSQRWETWESRQKWASDEQKSLLDNDIPALLHEGDALYCEWDALLREYFFGVEPRYEAARWGEGHWKEFIHPEYEEALNASYLRQNKNITLHDCLLEFTKEEQLGEDDLWYCPRCKKHQQATKKFDIWTIPDILVVHLKRFSNSRILRDKIDAFVEFPVEGLDLSEFCGEREVINRLVGQGEDLEGADTDEPLIYDLYAVDEHIGGLGGGHYRAYAYNTANEEWYHFDDSFVSRSDASEAVNQNAYLLFYKRRSSRPIGGKSLTLIEMAKQKEHAEVPSDVQLPTPPSESGGSTVLQMDTEADGDVLPPYGQSSALDTKLHVTNASQRRQFPSFPTPPPGSPPSTIATKPFTELFDDTLIGSGYLDFPDPSATGSPSSSIEVEVDDTNGDIDIDDHPFDDFNQEGSNYRSRSNSQMDINSAYDNTPNWSGGRGWDQVDIYQPATEPVQTNSYKEIPIGESSLLDIDE